ncbi:MAG TPA: NAD-dependent succinate-semialdehyde dehydrogenase [bacterium]|nr:NAD-dependent succinate-semialdehyde dehydrogenase [bacterium]
MYRTLNPATEELIREYPEHTPAQIDAALARSREAFAAWRATPIDQRVAVVRKLASLVRARLARYGALVTQEMGKPFSQAQVEIDKCGRGCDYYTTSAKQALDPQTIQTEAAKSYVRYDPLGAILGIMPWNFPFWQVFRFAVPAVLAGNVVLLKHAPNVPACALEIESVFREAGAPEGVFQSLFLINDDAAKLIASGEIAGVSLTGSDRAGSAVASVAGKNLVKTVLELGGSDPFIVFDDADLDATIPVAVKARMLNTGQSCIAAKRFLVNDKIYPEFQRRLLEAVKALKVGDPTQADTDLGPLAREDLLANLVKQVGEAKKQGAKVLLEGGRRPGKGYFYEPTVLEGVAPGMVAFDQEVFGPVVSLVRFKADDEAVALANQTPFGLGASLWTRDTAKAEAIAARIDAGNVFVNGMVKSDPRLPFGGVKRSGYGRELSVVGIHEFTNVKTVWVG